MSYIRPNSIFYDEFDFSEVHMFTVSVCKRIGHHADRDKKPAITKENGRSSLILCDTAIEDTPTNRCKA